MYRRIRWPWRELSEFFFPAVCRFCNEVGPIDEQQICADCWNSLEPAAPDADYGILERTHMDDVRFAFTYSGFLHDLIHALKYDHLTAIVPRLAKSIEATWPIGSDWDEATCIVPVPLHPRKRRERGYNQTELIAVNVARLLKCAVHPQALIRRVNNVSQTMMAGPEERKQNVANIFEVNPAAPLVGQTVILLDDVITTGSTINSCAEALKRHGAEKVLGFGIGRPVFVK